MKILDIVIMFIDLMLFMYFFNLAMNTTEMDTRLIACAAMTMEIYFIRKHMKIMKISTTKNKK